MNALHDTGVSRRRFLGATALGAAAIWSGGALARVTDPVTARTSRRAEDILRPIDVQYFTMMLPAVIVQARSEQDSSAFVDSFERMLAPAAPSTLGAIRDLVDLLTGSVTQPLMTLSLSDWSEKRTDEVTSVLESWVDSRLGIKRVAYGITTSLIRTAWYMQPEAQAITGYPGAPRKVVGAGGGNG